MNLFRSFQPAASAPVARERLQILLEYDRKLGSQIDVFTVLREEILAVVSRHIVDPENVQVTVDRGAKFSTLGVNIQIPNPGGKVQQDHHGIKQVRLRKSVQINSGRRQESDGPHQQFLSERMHRKCHAGVSSSGARRTPMRRREIK